MELGRRVAVCVRISGLRRVWEYSYAGRSFGIRGDMLVRSQIRLLWEEV
jgi:hypothetical protein